MIRPPNDFIENLEQSLGEFTEYAKPQFTRRPEDWGTIDFERIRGSIDETCEQAADLKAMPLGLLPLIQFQEVKERVDQLATIFAEIDSFDVGAGGDPTVRRDDIATRFEQEAEQFFHVYQRHVSYLAHRRGSHAVDVRESRAATAEVKELLESAREESADKLQELEQVISAARTAAPDVATPEFASSFEREAERAAKHANMWLFAIAYIYLFTLLFLGWIAFRALAVDDDPSVSELLYHFAFKLPFVAVFLTGAFWCGRHYAVAKQQAIVNRHRAHSIRAFQAFAAAAHEPAVKDIVLTQAMECVFVHVATGLTRQEGSPSKNQISVDLGKALDQTVASSQRTQQG